MGTNRHTRTVAGLLVAGTFGLAACAGLSQKQKGAVIGATTGAAVGGVIGNQTGSTARGAIIGAVIGGAAGAGLDAGGKGGTGTSQTNRTDAGRGRNRRVEIAIYGSEAYRKQVKSGTQ